MKKLIAYFFAAFILVLISGNSIAYHTSAKLPMKMSAVLQKLSQFGYYGFREIDFDNGIYEVKAFDSQGQSIKIKFNPALSSPSVTKTANGNRLTMLQAVKKLEAAGYVNIFAIEFDYGHYEAKVIDHNGNIQKLYIDVNSGEITKGN